MPDLMRPEDVPAELVDAGREALVKHLASLRLHHLPTLEEQVRAVLVAALPAHEIAVRQEVARENDATRPVCPRCRMPEWAHDLWKCTPHHMPEFVGDDELRRDVLLRELNQGALAGMPSEVSEYAADLLLAVLNRYDAWKAAQDGRSGDGDG